jgi:hypothetical protein
MAKLLTGNDNSKTAATLGARVSVEITTRERASG